MKPICKISMIFILLILSSTYAQYQLSRSVIAGGGAKMIGAQNAVQGTIGQTFVGRACGTYCIGSGFWYDFPAQESRILPAADELPREFRLEQNYPNPFNPSTIIRFALPQQVYLSLKLYDLLGREIKSLAEGEFPAGCYNILLESHGLTSGSYFYRLQAGNFVAQRRLLLLK